MHTYDVKTIEGLKAFCKELRGFVPSAVMEAKLKAINDFFGDEGLDTAVVGLSGGIDSTLVYYMLCRAAKENGSPIKKVHGVFMPIKAEGITGQFTAEMHVNLFVLNRQVCNYDVAEYSKVDLSEVARAYYNTVNPSTPWSKGQIASIIRTPALYGIAAELQVSGCRSIVVGTTNRDEGAYIGFFGKASDGMVDLQPIADLHKSEVRALSSLLGVPSAIINRPPEGDVWDDKTDEEMIGAPYWFLELYQVLMENDATYLIGKLTDCPNAAKWALNIESAHAKNAHKYKVGSPARYVDVIKRTLEKIKI